MILVAGGTGLLGTQVVPRLTARNFEVRVLTRDPVRARASASATHPMSLFRMKQRAEDSLRASGVPWTIVRPINPVLARQIHGGIVMDTSDMTSSAEERVRRYPTIPVTPLAEVVRQSFVR